jgi:hypothetical protein
MLSSDIRAVSIDPDIGVVLIRTLRAPRSANGIAPARPFTTTTAR